MISHHGAAKTFAENTVQAFRFALQNEGANAVEVDICMTQDGEIVAWHDWDPDDEVSLLRQMGRQPDNLYKPAVPGIGSEWRRPVISLRLDEFVQHYGYEKLDRDYHQPTPPVPAELAIPLLRDVMAELTQHANLQAVFLDVKMPDDSSGRAAEMLDHIHESIPRDRSFATVLLVPAKRVLQNMKKRDHQNNYQLPFSYDREFPAGIIFNVQDFSAIDSAFDMKNDVASVGRPTSATLLPWKTYTRLLGYDLPKWSKIRNTTGGWGAEGLVRWYIAWTFNDPGELECLCELGVSGIITDDVTRLRQIAHAKGRI